MFWTLLTPIAIASMYYFVFRVVFKVQAPHYLVYVLSGVLPWTFFANTIVDGMESIVNNAPLLTKISIPAQVFPLSGMLTALINLACAFPIIFAGAYISGVHLNWAALLYPILMFAVLFMAYALALVLGVCFVFLRDLRHIISVGLQIWFYGTPVLYQPAMIPEQYQWILYANPIAPFLVAGRIALIEGGLPPAELMAVGVGWFVLFMSVALFVQRSFMRGLAEHI